MKPRTFALVGYPNCGKSTLFNALTGLRASVGNWSGVTVDIEQGEWTINRQKCILVDLPGICTLTQVDDSLGLDSKIVQAHLHQGQADVIINVIDACHLQTQLYLTLQLREMGLPMVVAVTMVDQAKKEGLDLDLTALSDALACPVVPLESVKKKGLNQLKEAAAKVAKQPGSQSPLVYPEIVEQAIDALMEDDNDRWEAIQCLSGDCGGCTIRSASQQQLLAKWQKACGAQLGQEADLLVADSRYTWIHELVAMVVQKKEATVNMTALIDNIVLNRVLGIPIFLLVLYGMFMFAIGFVGSLQDTVGLVTEWLFVDSPALWLQRVGCPGWLVHVVSEGIGRGINTTLTFMPVLVGIYTYLGLLEGSGYMSRAAFVMDRLMRTLGLPGKAFVPLIIGFGCNVPAVMATRTLSSTKDRLMTAMMVPFMSCSARLAIFSVFAGAFFPNGGHNVIFCLYLGGVCVALLTGLMLRRLFKGESDSNLVMTLPSYHWPRPSVLFRQVLWRVRGFIKRAGKIIIPLSLVLSLVSNPVSVHGGNAMSTLGKTVVVVLQPMGVEQENWPAAVGLVSGVMAKEVVIGTLNSLYTNEHKRTMTTALWQEKWQAVKSSFKGDFGLVPKDEEQISMSDSALGKMASMFHSQASVIAYLVFVLLYFPCVSTLAVIVREVSPRWALISVGWATGVAYCIAVATYQGLTIQQHVMMTFVWWGILAVVSATGYFVLQYLWRKGELSLKASRERFGIAERT